MNTTRHDITREPSGIDPEQVRSEQHPNLILTRFLNVDYAHMKTRDGGDLYLTRHGMPFARPLQPENWYARKWFRANREKLEGTSTIYRVPTRPVGGRSIELVVKWCRVGQDVPLETRIIEDVLQAEFNSPFEEFSLVEELRDNASVPGEAKIMLQKPLGIYAPPERLQLWQTGRSKRKIMSKIQKHPGVELDILRQYILMYRWVRGLNAVDAFAQAGLSDESLAAFTHAVIDAMRCRGYRVLDQKPAHFIVRVRPDNTILRSRKNGMPYALVDFELLERTPEHEAAVKAERRERYLKKQRDRFKTDAGVVWPQHLAPVRIMGVDYVCGPTESTAGMLWVVGNDPDLFDYFQPERWRKTPQTRLSHTDDIYYTRTKDNIHIVWKVSKVGEPPRADSASGAQRLQDYGYNSPFEEFARAFALSRRGMATVYPRAIYMTGSAAGSAEVADMRRFESHRHVRTPSGEPILRPDHDYITVWGFWNGLDEFLAERDGEFCTGINALNATRRDLITDEEFHGLVTEVTRRLAECGMEDLALKGSHILLTLSPKGELVRDTAGGVDVRYCNFEAMRDLRTGAP